jgi:hypothetical protein
MPPEVMVKEPPGQKEAAKPPAPAERLGEKPPAPPAQRRWLSSDVFRAIGSWTGSMILHAVGLILLAITMLPSMLQPEPPQLEAIVARPEEEISQFLEDTVVPATEVTFNTSCCRRGTIRRLTARRRSPSSIARSPKAPTR